MTDIYRVHGFKPIRQGKDPRYGIQTVRDAAGEFAERMARRLGKRGCVGALRADSWRENGSAFTYEAFIGRQQPDGMISGHSEWFTVTVERE